MGIPVKRYTRRKIMGDASSPELWYLQPVAGSHQVYDIEAIADDIEVTGALSKEDVVHVMHSFVRRLRSVLTQGNRVKVDKLGTFYLTFACNGTEQEKDCTVKNIKRVNVRFKVDNSLRLVNDSIATTRGAENNVQFYIKSTATDSNPGGGEEDDDDFVDPTT